MPNEQNKELCFNAFQSKPEKTTNGYKVLVIHAGIARPITGGVFHFKAEVLKPAVRLWNGVNCFADHDLNGESVKGLAGVFSNPEWSEEHQGIIAELRPTGPAAHLIYMFGEEMLGNHDQHPDMGFSPIIIFRADSEEVTEIIRCRSTDLVISPAFENANFIAQFQRSNTMKKKFILQDGSTAEYEEGQQPQGAILHSIDAESHISAMKKITGAQTEIHSAVQGAKEMHLAACQQLLTSSLDAQLELPQEAKDLISARFSGKTFTIEELKKEIDQFNKAFAKQKENSVIAGPAQITGMFSSGDQLQAAMDDLLDAPRDAGAESLKVHRFRGIKDAYLFLTGDYNFVGDVEPQLARFQGSTATFPKIVANALNKSIVKHFKQFGQSGYDWWRPITTIESFENLNDVTWLRLGSIGSLPVVAEGGEYQELRIGDNGETSSFDKHGGYVALTLEAIDRDNTRLLRGMPRELALGAIRNISEQIAAIFTSANGAGPTLADGGALFNATAVTTAGGHANLRTTALGTNYTEWDAIATAMYDQPMLVANESGLYGTGKKQAVEPSYIIVPRSMKAGAEALFIPRLSEAVDAGIPTSGQATYAGAVRPIVCPEFTDSNNFAAVIDPMMVPGVMLGTRFGLEPQIILAGDQNSPAMFMNDESRLKVRHFLTVGVGNWSALHKSNVA